MADESNAQIVWNFFKTHQLPASWGGGYLSDAQVAGIMGSGSIESGFIPDIYSEDGKYYGLFQWGDERRNNLESMLGAKKSDLYAQLEFAWDEWTNGGYESQQFRNAMFGADATGTPEDYAYRFRRDVERPSADDSADRQREARRYMDALGSGGSGLQTGYTGSTMSDIFAPAAQAMGGGMFDAQQDPERSFYGSTQQDLSNFGAVIQNFVDSQIDYDGAVGFVSSLYGMMAHSGGVRKDLSETTLKNIKSSLPNDKNAQEFIILNAMDDEQAQYMIEQKQKDYQRKAELEKWQEGQHNILMRGIFHASGIAGIVADPTMLIPTLGAVSKLRIASRLGDGLMNISKAERIGNFAVHAGAVGTDAVIGTLANDILMDNFTDKDVHYGQDAAAAFVIGSVLGSIGGLAGAYHSRNKTLIDVAQKLDTAESNVYAHAAGLPTGAQRAFSKEQTEQMNKILSDIADEEAKTNLTRQSKIVDSTMDASTFVGHKVVYTTSEKARKAIEQASGMKLKKGARGFWSPSTNTITLFADKIKSEEFDNLLLHEVTHSGLHAILKGTDYHALMNSVNQLRKHKGNDFYVASHRYGTTNPEEIVAYVLQDPELKFPEKTLKGQILDIVNSNLKEQGFATRFTKEELIHALTHPRVPKEADIQTPTSLNADADDLPPLFSDLMFSEDNVGNMTNLLTYGTLEASPVPFIERDLAQGKFLGKLPNPLKKAMQWFGDKVENGYYGDAIQSRSAMVRSIGGRMFNDARGRGFGDETQSITAEDNMLRIYGKLATYLYDKLAPLENAWVGKWKLNRKAADQLWWKMLNNAYNAKNAGNRANVMENIPEEVQKAIKVVEDFFKEEENFLKHSSSDVGSDAKNMMDADWYAVDGELPRFVSDELRAKFITDNYVNTAEKTALEQAEEDLKEYILKAAKRRGDPDDALKKNSIEGQILREKKKKNAQIDRQNAENPEKYAQRNAEADKKAQEALDAMSPEEREGYVATQAERDAWIESQERNPNAYADEIRQKKRDQNAKLDDDTLERIEKWRTEEYPEGRVREKILEEREKQNKQIDKENQKAYQELFKRNRRALKNGASINGVPYEKVREAVGKWFAQNMSNDDRIRMIQALLSKGKSSPKAMIRWAANYTILKEADILDGLAKAVTDLDNPKLVKKPHIFTEITNADIEKWWDDNLPSYLQKRLNGERYVDPIATTDEVEALIKKRAPKVWNKDKEGKTLTRNRKWTPREHIDETVTDEEINKYLEDSVDDMVKHWLGDFDYDPTAERNLGHLGELPWLKHRIPIDTSFSMPLAHGMIEFSFDNNLRSYNFNSYLEKRIRRVAGEIAVHGVFGSEKNLKAQMDIAKKQLQKEADDHLISRGRAREIANNLEQGINALRGVRTGEEDALGKAQTVGRILRGYAYFKNGVSMGLNQLAEVAGSVAYGGVSQVFSWSKHLQKLVDDMRMGKVTSDALTEIERYNFGTSMEYQLFRNVYEDSVARSALTEKTIANKGLIAISDGIHNLSKITSALSFLPKTTEWMVRSMRRQTIIDSILWAEKGAKAFSKVRNPFSKAKLKAARVTEDDVKAIRENLREFTHYNDLGELDGLDVDAWKAKDMHSYLKWFTLIQTQAERAITPSNRVGNTNLYKNNHGILPQILLQFKDYSLRSMNAQTMRALTSGELDDAIAAGMSVITNLVVYAGRAKAWALLLSALGFTKEAEDYEKRMLSDGQLLRATATRSTYLGTPLSFANDLYEIGMGAETVRTSVQRRSTGTSWGNGRTVGDAAKDAVGQIPALQNVDTTLLGAYALARIIDGDAKDKDFDRFIRALPIPNIAPLTALIKLMGQH